MGLREPQLGIAILSEERVCLNNLGRNGRYQHFFFNGLAQMDHPISTSAPELRPLSLPCHTEDSPAGPRYSHLLPGACSDPAPLKHTEEGDGRYRGRL